MLMILGQLYQFVWPLTKVDFASKDPKKAHDAHKMALLRIMPGVLLAYYQYGFILNRLGLPIGDGALPMTQAYMAGLKLQVQSIIAGLSLAYPQMTSMLLEMVAPVFIYSISMASYLIWCTRKPSQALKFTWLSAVSVVCLSGGIVYCVPFSWAITCIQQFLLYGANLMAHGLGLDISRTIQWVTEGLPWLFALGWLQSVWRWFYRGDSLGLEVDPKLIPHDQASIWDHVKYHWFHRGWQRMTEGLWWDAWGMLKAMPIVSGTATGLAVLATTTLSGLSPLHQLAGLGLGLMSGGFVGYQLLVTQGKTSNVKADSVLQPQQWALVSVGAGLIATLWHFGYKLRRLLMPADLPFLPLTQAWLGRWLPMATHLGGKITAWMPGLSSLVSSLLALTSPSLMVASVTGVGVWLYKRPVYTIKLLWFSALSWFLMAGGIYALLPFNLFLIQQQRLFIGRRFVFERVLDHTIFLKPFQVLAEWYPWVLNVILIKPGWMSLWDDFSEQKKANMPDESQTLGSSLYTHWHRSGWHSLTLEGLGDGFTALVKFMEILLLVIGGVSLLQLAIATQFAIFIVPARALLSVFVLVTTGKLIGHLQRSVNFMWDNPVFNISTKLALLPSVCVGFQQGLGSGLGVFMSIYSMLWLSITSQSVVNAYIDKAQAQPQNSQIHQVVKHGSTVGLMVSLVGLVTKIGLTDYLATFIKLCSMLLNICVSGFVSVVNRGCGYVTQVPLFSTDASWLVQLKQGLAQFHSWQPIDVSLLSAPSCLSQVWPVWLPWSQTVLGVTVGLMLCMLQSSNQANRVAVSVSACVILGLVSLAAFTAPTSQVLAMVSALWMLQALLDLSYGLLWLLKTLAKSLGHTTVAMLPAAIVDKLPAYTKAIESCVMPLDQVTQVLLCAGVILQGGLMIWLRSGIRALWSSGERLWGAMGMIVPAQSVNSIPASEFRQIMPSKLSQGLTIRPDKDLRYSHRPKVML